MMFWEATNILYPSFGQSQLEISACNVSFMQRVPVQIVFEFWMVLCGSSNERKIGGVLLVQFLQTLPTRTKLINILKVWAHFLCTNSLFGPWTSSETYLCRYSEYHVVYIYWTLKHSDIIISSKWISFLLVFQCKQQTSLSFRLNDYPISYLIYTIYIPFVQFHKALLFSNLQLQRVHSNPDE